MDKMDAAKMTTQNDSETKGPDKIFIVEDPAGIQHIVDPRMIAEATGYVGEYLYTQSQRELADAKGHLEIEKETVAFWHRTADERTAEILRLYEQLAGAKQEFAEAQRLLRAELAANHALRKKHGAKENETFTAFVDRLAEELAEVKLDLEATKEALYIEALERDRYREALLRFKTKEITYSFDSRAKAERIVDEALNPPTPKPSDAQASESDDAVTK